MGASGGNAYTLAPADLDSVITDLEQGESKLDVMLADLERNMESLHGVWEGLSAQAHREALEEWRQGMSAMRTALADLRAAAGRAHENYTKVVADNSSIWKNLA